MHSATIFFGLAAVVATVAGVGVHHDIHAYPKYQYSYGVADKLTGDQKNAFEVRDGAVTKGSYSLVQPDGVLRTVNYIVTPLGGFQAQVVNKGVAGHPAIYGIHGRGLIGGGIGLGGGLGGAEGLGGLGGGLGGGRGGLAGGLGGGLGLGGARSVVGAIGSPIAGGIGGGLGGIGGGLGGLGGGLGGVGGAGYLG